MKEVEQIILLKKELKSIETKFDLPLKEVLFSKLGQIAWEKLDQEIQKTKLSQKNAKEILSLLQPFKGKDEELDLAIKGV